MSEGKEKPVILGGMKLDDMILLLAQTYGPDNVAKKLTELPKLLEQQRASICEEKPNSIVENKRTSNKPPSKKSKKSCDQDTILSSSEDNINPHHSNDQGSIEEVGGVPKDSLTHATAVRKRYSSSSKHTIGFASEQTTINSNDKQLLSRTNHKKVQARSVPKKNRKSCDQGSAKHVVQNSIKPHFAVGEFIEKVNAATAVDSESHSSSCEQSIGSVKETASSSNDDQPSVCIKEKVHGNTAHKRSRKSSSQDASQITPQKTLNLESICSDSSPLISNKRVTSSTVDRKRRISCSDKSTEEKEEEVLLLKKKSVSPSSVSNDDQLSVRRKKKVRGNTVRKRSRESSSQDPRQITPQTTLKSDSSEDEEAGNVRGFSPPILNKRLTSSTVVRKRCISSSDKSPYYTEDDENSIVKKKAASPKVILKEQSKDKNVNKHASSTKKALSTKSKASQSLSGVTETACGSTPPLEHSEVESMQDAAVHVGRSLSPSFSEVNLSTRVVECDQILSEPTSSHFSSLSSSSKRKPGNKDGLLLLNNVNEKACASGLGPNEKVCFVKLDRISESDLTNSAARSVVTSNPELSKQCRPMPRSVKEKYKFTAESPSKTLERKEVDVECTKTAVPIKTSRKSKGLGEKQQKIHTNFQTVKQQKEQHKAEHTTDHKKFEALEFKKCEASVRVPANEAPLVPTTLLSQQEVRHKAEHTTDHKKSKALEMKKHEASVGVPANESPLVVPTTLLTNQERLVSTKPTGIKEHTETTQALPDNDYNFLLPSLPVKMKTRGQDLVEKDKDFSDSFQNFHSSQVNKEKTDPLLRLKLDDEVLDYEEDPIGDDDDVISIFIDPCAIFKKGELLSDEEEDLYKAVKCDDDDDHASFGSSRHSSDMDMCVSEGETDNFGSLKDKDSQSFENVPAFSYEKPVLGAQVENYYGAVNTHGRVYGVNLPKCDGRGSAYSASKEITLKSNVDPFIRRNTYQTNNSQIMQDTNCSSDNVTRKKQSSGQIAMNPVKIDSASSKFSHKDPLRIQKDRNPNETGHVGSSPLKMQTQMDHTESRGRCNILPSQRIQYQPTHRKALLPTPSDQSVMVTNRPLGTMDSLSKDNQAALLPTPGGQSHMATSKPSGRMDCLSKDTRAALLPTPRDQLVMVTNTPSGRIDCLLRDTQAALLPTSQDQSVLVPNRLLKISDNLSNNTPISNPNLSLPLNRATSKRINNQASGIVDGCAMSNPGKITKEFDHVMLGKTDIDLRTMSNFRTCTLSRPPHNVQSFLQLFCMEYLDKGTCSAINCTLSHDLPEIKRADFSAHDKSYKSTILFSMFKHNFWLEKKLPHEVQELGNENESTLLLALSKRLWEKITERKQTNSYSVLWKHIADGLRSCGLSPKKVLSKILKSIDQKAATSNYDVIDEMLEVLYPDYIENQDFIWESLKPISLKNYQIPENVLREVLKGVLRYDYVDFDSVGQYLLTLPEKWRPKKPVEIELFDLIKKLAHKLHNKSPEICTKLLKHFDITPSSPTSNLVYSSSKKYPKSKKRFSLQCWELNVEDNDIKTFAEVQGPQTIADISSSNSQTEDSIVSSGSTSRIPNERVEKKVDSSVTSTREEEVTSSTEAIKTTPQPNDSVPKNISTEDTIQQSKPSCGNVSGKVSVLERAVYSGSEVNTSQASEMSEPLDSQQSEVLKEVKINTVKKVTKLAKKNNIGSKKINFKNIVQKKLVYALVGVILQIKDSKDGKHVSSELCSELKKLSAEERFNMFNNLFKSLKSRAKEILPKIAIFRIGLLLVKDFLSESLWQEAAIILDETLSLDMDATIEFDFSAASITLLKIHVAIHNNKLRFAISTFWDLNFCRGEEEWILSSTEDDVLSRDEVAEVLLQKCMDSREFLDNAVQLFKEMLRYKQCFRKYDVAETFYDNLLRSMTKNKYVKAALLLFSWAHTDHNLQPNEDTCRILCSNIPNMSEAEQINSSPLIVLLMEQKPYRDAVPSQVTGDQRVVVTIQPSWFIVEMVCVIKSLLHTKIINIPEGQELPEIVIRLQEGGAHKTHDQSALHEFGIATEDPSPSDAKNRLLDSLKFKLKLIPRNAQFNKNSIIVDKELLLSYILGRRQKLRQSQPGLPSSSGHRLGASNPSHAQQDGQGAQMPQPIRGQQYQEEYGCAQSEMDVSWQHTRHINRPPSQTFYQDFASVNQPPSQHFHQDFASGNQPPSQHFHQDFASGNQPPSQPFHQNFASGNQPPSQHFHQDFASGNQPPSQRFHQNFASGNQPSPQLFDQDFVYGNQPPPQPFIQDPAYDNQPPKQPFVQDPGYGNQLQYSFQSYPQRGPNVGGMGQFQGNYQHFIKQRYNTGGNPHHRNGSKSNWSDPKLL